MAKELYINDILCDLDEKDNPVALTYQVNNIAELANRNATTTNNFKLPPTQNNRKACGFPDDGALVQLQPYRNNSAKIVQNGIEIVPYGIAIITSSDAYINVQVTTGLTQFFSKLEGKNIRDLDLSAYDNVWDSPTVIASQTNTSGYVWPIIDYGGFPDTTKFFGLEVMRPATFRHTVLERLVLESGYTMSGAILSDPRHLKTLIPFALDKFTHGKNYIIGSGNPTSATKQVNQTLSNDDRDFDINFENYSTTNPDGWFDGITYAPTDIAKVKVSLKYDIDVRDQFRGGSNPSIAVRIFKNVSTIAENVHVGVGDFVTAEYRGQTLEAEFNVYPGDVVKITAHSEPATNRVLGVVLAGATVSFVKDVSEVIVGQTVQLEATLPDVSQKDFFKDWMQNFGVIAIEDPYKDKLSFYNMSDVYANKYRPKDWTNKFTDEPADNNYSFGNYGIVNYGKYKTDQNVPTLTGQGQMTFDNLTLEKFVTLFTSIYAASISVIKLDGMTVTQIKKIEDLAINTDFTIKTEYRLLMDNKINGNIPGFGVLSVPYFQSAGLPGLGYDELFAEYYPEIARMLYRPFVSTRKALLKPADLAELDYTIPIYDKKTAAYYYLNVIGEWIEDQECDVNLVKLQ